MPEAPPNPRPEGPRPPGPSTDPGPEALDLRAASPSARYPCPECGTSTLRLPTGRMRHHGATSARGRPCGFPEAEGLDLATPEGLDRLTRAHPQFRPVYDAVRRALDKRPHPRAHGGQLRHPDPRDPRWRWGR